MMRNQNLFLLLCCCIVGAATSCQDTLKDFNKIGDPTNLRYISITDAREGEGVSTAAPTVQAGGLTPTFEIVHVRRADGTLLEESDLQYFTMGTVSSVTIPVNPPDDIVDENGDPITSVDAPNLGDNGVISVVAGHDLPPDDYYFTIRVSTASEDRAYSTIFDDILHIRINPLLPNMIVYAPKNQNLVYGDANSETKEPIVPNGNADRRFALGSHTDELVIDEATGVISLASGYTYIEREVLQPIIHVISNISDEIVAFEEVVTIIITDTPEEMPVETLYFFYPSLYVTGNFPSGGDGFTVQTNERGNSQRIWGIVNNSIGKNLVAPAERPQGNTAQTVLETTTVNGSKGASITEPIDAWMVTTTQDLTPFQYGYNLSFSHYYLLAFWGALSDGRPPIDFEIYISTDYIGGDIQDAEGNWLNGTWTKVNADMKCSRSAGSAGEGWDAETFGFPTVGSVINQWIRCTYQISPEQISSTFTVAFKLKANFTGEVVNGGTPPGRGGRHFLSDFHYKAEESK